MEKSNIDKLMELKQLYEQGILTKEEMEVEKQKILNNSSSNSSKEPTYDERTATLPKNDSANDSFFQKNKKYILCGVGLIIVAILYLVFSNMSKKASPTIKETIESLEADVSDIPDTQKLGVKYPTVKELLKFKDDKNSDRLIQILKSCGFQQHKSDEELWYKTVEEYNADSIFVSWSSYLDEASVTMYSPQKEAMLSWKKELDSLGYKSKEEKGKEYHYLTYEIGNKEMIIINLPVGYLKGYNFEYRFEIPINAEYVIDEFDSYCDKEKVYKCVFQKISDSGFNDDYELEGYAISKESNEKGIFLLYTNDEELTKQVYPITIVFKGILSPKRSKKDMNSPFCYSFRCTKILSYY